MDTGIYFIVGLAMLYFGGEGLIRGASALGVRLGMSPLMAGLTIVAFATSAPELAVSVDAVTRGESGLAVGNVVGSNICNIALILGVTAVIKPPRLREHLVRRDVLVMLLATLLVPGLLLDDGLSRIEGVLLLACIGIYVTLTVWHARSRRLAAQVATFDLPILHHSVWFNVCATAVGIGLLVWGSKLFVDASVEIAMALGVPAAIVGLSAAALGTSLPELSTSIIAARHGHAEMAAGNLIGSNIFNLLLILGASALIAPLQPEGVGIVDFAVMIGVSLLALVLMVTKTFVTRAEGVLLIGVYAAYIIWLFGSP
jgi:cation:H+ antiporter